MKKICAIWLLLIVILFLFYLIDKKLKPVIIINEVEWETIEMKQLEDRGENGYKTI